MKRITYDQVIEKYKKIDLAFEDPIDLDSKIKKVIEALVDCINESCDIVENVQNHIKKGI